MMAVARSHFVVTAPVGNCERQPTAARQQAQYTKRREDSGRLTELQKRSRGGCFGGCRRCWRAGRIPIASGRVVIYDIGVANRGRGCAQAYKKACQAGDERTARKEIKPASPEPGPPTP